MNTETSVIINGIVDAFCKIGENGLAFAVRNMPESKAEQLAEIFNPAGYPHKGQMQEPAKAKHLEFIDEIERHLAALDELTCQLVAKTDPNHVKAVDNIETAREAIAEKIHAILEEYRTYIESSKEAQQ